MANKHPAHKAKADEMQAKSHKSVPEKPVVTDEQAGFFKSDAGENTSDDQGLSWTAQEFMAHAKSNNWYIGLGVLALMVTVAILITTRDLISCAVVIVGALMFGVYGSRQPREMEYSLDSSGFSVGSKSYYYHDFRYFSILGDSPLPSIDFMPLKRFSTVVTIHYSPVDQGEILAILDGRLPQHDGKEDAIERLMHRIRF